MSILHNISHGMASQYVPDDIRGFILKHIASVAQIEALLLIWSSPEERWGLPQIAARIYTSETEAAKALDGLCAEGLLVCRDGVFGLNASAENVEMIRRLQEIYARYLIPVTDVIHSKSRKTSLDGRSASASKGLTKCAAIICSSCRRPVPQPWRRRGALAQSRRPGGASGGLVRSTAIVCPEDLSLRTVDDGSVLHDLRQRRLLFGRQGLEGSGRTAKSAAEEELCADERPAEHPAFGGGEVAGREASRDRGTIRVNAGPADDWSAAPDASSWARMSVAVISQISAGCRIVRAVSL